MNAQHRREELTDRYGGERDKEMIPSASNYWTAKKKKKAITPSVKRELGVPEVTI